MTKNLPKAIFLLLILSILISNNIEKFYIFKERKIKKERERERKKLSLKVKKL